MVKPLTKAIFMVFSSFFLILPLKRLKDEPLFGGFMFWDASFDQNNIINGKHFSEHIKAMYGDQDLPSTGYPKTLPTKPNTMAPTSDKKLGLTNSTKPAEGPSKEKFS